MCFHHINDDTSNVNNFFRQCSFLTKTKVAEKAGAIAVIIADNDETNDGAWVDMVDDSTDRKVEIPSTFLLGKDGYVLFYIIFKSIPYFIK